jgi:hypothetical protein
MPKGSGKKARKEKKERKTRSDKGKSRPPTVGQFTVGGGRLSAKDIAAGSSKKRSRSTSKSHKSKSTKRHRKSAPPSMASGNVKAIERMMIFPMSGTVRLQDGLTQISSSVSEIYEKQDTSWNNAAATTVRDVLPITQHAVYLSRDPLRAKVELVRNTTAGTAVYIWQSTLNNNQSEVTPGETSDLGDAFNVPNSVIAGARVIKTLFPITGARVSPPGSITFPTSTFDPHGGFIFAGKDKERTGIWIDANVGSPATVVLVAGNGGVPPFRAGTGVSLFRWQNGWRVYSNIVLAADATTISFTNQIIDAGYYCIGDMILFGSNLAPGPASMNIYHSQTADSWSHKPIPQLIQSPLSNLNGAYLGPNFNMSKAIRVLGFNFLFSNRTVDAFKNGTIIAKNLEGDSSWMEYLISKGVNTSANTVFNDLLKDNKVFDTKGTKGFFGFGVIEDVEDLIWRKNVDFDEDNETPMSGFFPILDPAPGFIMVANIPIAGLASNVQPDFFSTREYAIEFHTDNMWLHQGLPRSTQEDFEKAARSVMRMPNLMSSMDRLYV